MSASTNDNGLISLEEWHRRFPPGTMTYRLEWRRVTPVPTMPAIEGFPPDMKFDWPPRLIMGRVCYDWDEPLSTENAQPHLMAHGPEIIIGSPS